MSSSEAAPPCPSIPRPPFAMIWKRRNAMSHSSAPGASTTDPLEKSKKRHIPGSDASTVTVRVSCSVPTSAGADTVGMNVGTSGLSSEVQINRTATSTISTITVVATRSCRRKEKRLIAYNPYLEHPQTQNQSLSQLLVRSRSLIISQKASQVHEVHDKSDPK